MSVADNAANLRVFAKHRCNNGGSGYPLMRVMVLVSCPSAIHARDADVLVRLKNGRRMPVVRRLPDASYLSVIGMLTVQVIDAEIAVATSGGAALAPTGWPPCWWSVAVSRRSATFDAAGVVASVRLYRLASTARAD